MRKRDGDMEIALEVPQPRLRAVPSDPAPAADSPSDAELLARVGDRDREVFEVLYGRYVRAVFGLALRKLGDRGQAEDAVQEPFTPVLGAAAAYRSGFGAAGGSVLTGGPVAVLDLRRP